MPPPRVITSFIVRIVEESAPGGPAPHSWRGIVRHLQSGREQNFLDVSDVALYIAEFIPHVEPDREPPDGPIPVRSNGE
ncbi:MAG: hypothetical protein ACRDIB_16955 [Ardenticatenaceae bacterium]